MKTICRAGLAALALFGLARHAAAAEEDPRPKWNNLRFEEDWSKFTSDQAVTKLDKAKHVQLSDNVWVSFGGKLRLRFESWSNFNFTGDADDAYLMYRTFVHSDWHFGEHFRIYVEGRYSNLTGRDLPGSKREALDVDRMDLWNTFVEGKWAAERANVMVRLGRQELSFGKQRLISPLDWSNNRRIFDGGLIRVAGPNKKWQVDAFSTMPVIIDGDWWTFNETDESRLFSGVYYTQKLGEKHTLEAYGLALNHIRQAPIADDRYTFGVRGYGPVVDNLTFDVEGGIQFGNREVANLTHDTHQDLFAWFVASELMYTFNQVDWKPYLAAGFDYASGDADPLDRDVGTFNQLFPLGHAYFGYADMVGRANIIDASATFGAWPVPKKLHVKADAHFFWLAQDDDGLYGAGGTLARSARFTTPGGQVLMANDKHVGQELDLTVQYLVNRYLTLQAGYSHVWASSFLDTTGDGEDVDFAYVQAEFTF